MCGTAVAKHGAASAPYITYGVWIVLWCCALCIALFSSTWCQGGMVLPCCGVVSLPPTLWLVLLSLFTLLSLYQLVYTISRYLYLRAPAVDSCDSSRFASSSSMFLHPLYTLHTRIHSYTRTLIHSIHSIHSFTPPSPPPLSLLPLLPLLRFFPPPPSAPSQGRPDERRGERRDATEFRGVAWVPLRRTCRSVDAASVADDVSLHWADRRTDC